MLNESLPTHALLAVLPDRRAADEVVSRLTARGIDPASIRVGAPADEVTSLDAEVREEITQSGNSPTVGVAYPKETVKAGMVFFPPAVAIGAVLGALAALPFGLGDWPTWLQLLVGAIVGATMAGAIGAVVIPAMSVKNPHDPSVADTGTTLRVERPGPEAFEVLLAAEPLRLDRLDAHGAAIDTVATEDDFTEGGIVEEVAGNFAREAEADPEDKTR